MRKLLLGMVLGAVLGVTPGMAADGGRVLPPVWDSIQPRPARPAEITPDTVAEYLAAVYYWVSGCKHNIVRICESGRSRAVLLNEVSECIRDHAWLRNQADLYIEANSSTQIDEAMRMAELCDEIISQQLLLKKFENGK